MSLSSLVVCLSTASALPVWSDTTTTGATLLIDQASRAPTASGNDVDGNRRPSGKREVITLRRRPQNGRIRVHLTEALIRVIHCARFGPSERLVYRGGEHVGTDHYLKLGATGLLTQGTL